MAQKQEITNSAHQSVKTYSQSNMNCLCLVTILLLFVFVSSEGSLKQGLQVVTVASESNDGFQRFIRSAKKYELDVKVLGLGKPWLGGDMEGMGGGYKIQLLKSALEDVKDDTDLIIMFVDSYDVVFTGGATEILKEFKKSNARVLFSAEGFCWPDRSLAESYPKVKPNEKRYLNSGGYIGYANEIWKMVNEKEIKPTDDDQLYYTNIYLNTKLRDEHQIKLDSRGEIFQNLNGALDDVRIKFKGSSSYLYNMKTGVSPIVIHGNGPIKPAFNNLANYLADAWTPTGGCAFCKEATISLEGLKNEDFPKVFMALFISKPTAFITEFFNNIDGLTYPKDRIDLFIYYATDFHSTDLSDFMGTHGAEYSSAQIINPSQGYTDHIVRNKAIEECVKQGCEYYLSIDSDVQIETPDIIQTLIEKNRTVIAPMLTRPNKMWSNFWGALNADGWYKRSDDYIDIVQYKKVGQWNVPYMSQMMMVHGYVLPSIQGGYINGDFDADMAMCKTMRNKNIFMFIDNQLYYGHLVNSENYVTTQLNNDMYSLFDNKYTWEKKYLHPLYKETLESDKITDEPCTDVYRIPIFSHTFCDHLIGNVEHYGKWSGGKNDDPRLAGGYENVPTVDIHMNQVGWEQHWLEIIKSYIGPINQKIYTGYFTDARAIMNFVVRYKPGEQDRLRPHHDASTYTINLALNVAGQDYEGGGVNFLRYDCKVVNITKGYMLMHPGRLTHIHEGLQTTKGTRYIMVSFIDP